MPATRTNTTPLNLGLRDLLAEDFVDTSYVDDHAACSHPFEGANGRSHIEAFAHALKLDEAYFDHHGDTSSPQIPGTPVSSFPRILKVSALSDFAPINLKVKRYTSQLPLNSISRFFKNSELLGAGKKPNRINGVITYLFFYAGPYWCVSSSFFFFFGFCNESSVLHISVHHGGVRSLHNYQAAG
jgi:hypothetical protein